MYPHLNIMDIAKIWSSISPAKIIIIHFAAVSSLGHFHGSMVQKCDGTLNSSEEAMLS